MKVLSTFLKDIPGFEGLYGVTKHGRVWAHPKEIERGSSLGKRFKTYHKGKWLKNRIDKEGYAYVTLTTNKVRQTKKVHRYIAMAYLPNPKNLPEVNHKNCKKLDNRVSNLEWCTRMQNVQHAILNGRYAERDRKIKDGKEK